MRLGALHADTENPGIVLTDSTTALLTYASGTTTHPRVYRFRTAP
jgi:hypothetical protein